MLLDLGKRLNFRFGSEIFADGFLNVAAEWIGDELSPEDVFEEQKLRDWAYEHGFIEVDE
jgi:hypothetical protein